METIKNTEVKKLQDDGLVKKIPDSPKMLSTVGRRYWKSLSATLIDAKVLKKAHLPALEILADQYAQYEEAALEIKLQNKEKRMSGYVQTFTSGAQNVSVYVTLKKDAAKTILQILKQFGMDPKSEKDLNMEPPNQLSLLEILNGTQSA